MNHKELYGVLCEHQKLSERRSPLYAQSRASRIVGGVLAFLAIGYLMFLSVMLAMIALHLKRYTGYELMFVISPIILALDFLLRLTFQQTPSQLIKPYLLLPLPRHACIDCFLFSSLTNTFNLLWFALFAPYALMCIVFSEGFLVACGFLLGLYLLILINSQWYLLVRSLMISDMRWSLLPLAFYGAFIALGVAWGFSKSSPMFIAFARLGSGLSFFNPLYIIGVVALLALLIYANRLLQYKLIRKETSKVEESAPKHTFSISFLEHFGVIGEYLRLEVKSIMRNKNLKKSFLGGLVIICIYSAMLTFMANDIDVSSRRFMFLYCFMFYGSVTLCYIMCYEGNYIDLLMMHKEEINSLLCAKYYFYNILLLIPFVLLLPTLFMGTSTLLELLAYLIFTAGVIHFILFQLAVYNKQTMPLNEKLTGKNASSGQFIKAAIVMGVFATPVIIIQVLSAFTDNTITNITLIVIGSAFILSHRLWINGIYRRLMARKYTNLEGFHATRQLK